MQLRYNDNNYDIVIERKNNKRTYIRVKDDLKIHVSTNYFETNFSIKKLIKDNYREICKMIDNATVKKENNSGFFYLGKKYTIVHIEGDDISFSNDIVYIGRDVDIDKWYKSKAKDLFLERLNYNYDKFSRKNEFLINIIFLLIFFPFLFIFNKETYELIYPYKDFYTVYSLFLGYTLGSVIDNKYVNYSCNTSIKKKIIRTIVSFLIIIVCVGGLKIVFPKNNMFLVFLRYFLSTFITMGISPLLLKNNLFKD